MAATTDFAEWLDSHEPSGYEEVWGLAQAASRGGNYHPYIGKERGGNMIISSERGGEVLIIASDKALSTFLEILRQRYCGDMTIDGYYYFHRAMEKDD